MTHPLLKKSEHEQKPMTLGLIVSLLFLCLIMGGTAWFFVGFTQPRSSSADAAGTSDGETRSNAGSQSRSQRKLAATQFQQEMLEKDKKLRAKYDAVKRQRSGRDKPDKQKAYRKWRDQKEQNEKFLSKFKSDQSTDPNSIKAQLLKSNQSLDDDRPVR